MMKKFVLPVAALAAIAFAMPAAAGCWYSNSNQETVSKPADKASETS